MSYAYDFSRVPGPSADEIKNAEGEGALTYGTGRQQDPDYLAGLESAGLQTALIWEHNVDSILGGEDYGVSEAQAWNAAHAPGKVIYCACDLNDGRLGGASVAPFLTGWATQLRPGDALGIYGPDHAIAQARTVPAVTHFWGVVNWLEQSWPNNDQRNIDRWNEIGAHLVQLIGSPIGGTDQNLVLRGDWASAAGSVPSRPSTDHRKEADMVIYHNTDVKDPDPNTAKGEWVAVYGSDGPTAITAAAAYAHALAGVPWLDKQNTLGIVALGLHLAQTRKDAAFWDAKLKG